MLESLFLLEAQMKNSKPLLQRYFPEPNSGCWLWEDACDRDGYGVARLNGKQVRAHRLFYAEHVGAIADGALILHSCDVRSCVNPAHLSAGSNDQNMQEMVDRGRSPARERNPKAKLTSTAIAEIRRLYAVEKLTLKALAAKYGVCFQNIHHIVRGSTWS